MKNKSRKVLICGYGSMGKKYHELIAENIKQVKIVILTSQELKGIRGNVEIVKDINSAMSKDCTHAIIANPATMHIDYTCKMLNNGVNTLVEKPLFTGQEQDSQIKKLITIKNKENAFVGYVLRQDIIIKRVKQIVDSGDLGELIAIDAKCGSWLPDWRPDRNYKETVSAKNSQGGGVLLELSHEIDLIMYLAGKIDVKYGLVKNTGILGIETEDLASITGVTEKGAIVNIGIDFCSKPTKRYGEIKLSNGSISYDLIQREVVIDVYNKGTSNEYNMPQDSKERLMNQINYLFENTVYQRKDFCSIDEGIEVVNVIRKVKKK